MAPDIPDAQEPSGEPRRGGRGRRGHGRPPGAGTTGQAGQGGEPRERQHGEGQRRGGDVDRRGSGRRQGRPNQRGYSSEGQRARIDERRQRGIISRQDRDRRPRPTDRSDPRRRQRALLDSLRHLQRGASIDPYQRFVLETTPDQLSTRVVDLIAPIGRGQRVLITSPPKAGKTMLLEAVARAILTNHTDVQVVCLLIDERPEEVTWFRRSVACEVVASSNDMMPEDHVRLAEETVIRVAEEVLRGRDVVLLLDSITRLARAYNVFADGSGRTLSGGLDASTMYGPRRIFGAARKVEGGGSLTILGTALVDTGSRMDEVIFQEFKGTGNTEIVLNRNLANKRIFPALDVLASGSRKEEKLYAYEDLRRVHILRRFLVDRKPEEAMLGLIKMMERYPTNAELLKALG